MQKKILALFSQNSHEQTFQMSNQKILYWFLITLNPDVFCGNIIQINSRHPVVRCQHNSLLRQKWQNSAAHHSLQTNSAEAFRSGWTMNEDIHPRTRTATVSTASDVMGTSITMFKRPSMKPRTEGNFLRPPCLLIFKSWFSDSCDLCKRGISTANRVKN